MLLSLRNFQGDWTELVWFLGITALGLLVAITVHEFCHALLAYSLGDRLAHSQGRLTLNPLAHLDPAGTLFIVLFGFGWGRPVPFRPAALRINPKAGMALVALAGPASNFLMATSLALPLQAVGMPYWALQAVYQVYQVNLLLGIFNLIPIAPLDGFKVAVGILPPGVDYQFARTEPYGVGILMALIGLGYFTDLDPLSYIIGPAFEFVSGLLGL